MTILGRAGAEAALRQAKRILVLGIKPKSRSQLAAYWIPQYLQSVGYEIIPFPVRYPEATEILGAEPVRSFRDVKGAIDIVSLFIKPDDVAQYVDDLIELHPSVVWFQSGLLHAASADRLSVAGIDVVHYCIGCVRAEVEPPCRPLGSR